jgi:hypothetical protein
VLNTSIQKYFSAVSMGKILFFESIFYIPSTGKIPQCRLAFIPSIEILDLYQAKALST